MPVIVLTNHYDKEPLEIISSAVPEGFRLITLPAATREELLKVCGQADYLLASGRVGIDGDVIKAAPKLKMIQRTGVGTDTLDREAISGAGIPVYVNRGVNADSVAEHTLMLILATLRRTAIVDSRVRGGIWQKQRTGVGNHMLKGKTVGLVGAGTVGRRVAELLQAFGVNLIYSDVQNLSAEEEARLNMSFRTFDELLKEADVVAFCCALTDETRHMLNSENIGTMKQSAVVVNTARGGVIETEALVKALADGTIAAAGIDVYEKEPPAGDNPLFRMGNVILSPHIAGVTYESFRQMMDEAMANIKAFEEGRREELADRRFI